MWVMRVQGSPGVSEMGKEQFGCRQRIGERVVGIVAGQVVPGAAGRQCQLTGAQGLIPPRQTPVFQAQGTQPGLKHRCPVQAPAQAIEVSEVQAGIVKHQRAPPGRGQ